MTDGQDRRQLEHARRAVAVVFAVNGLAFASWVSRVPAARDALDLSPARLGLLLLCLSGGSVAALPLSGPVVSRIGTSAAVRAAGTLVSLGLGVLAAGLASSSTLVAGAGLLVTGLGVSTWDVAMNVEGADVERALGRTLMPRLHAGFSIGTVAGALVGAGASAAGLSFPVQLLATGVLVLPSLLVATRWFVPHVALADQTGPPGPGARQAWAEPRTLVIGLVVLAFAFTEGTANDWLSLAVVDGYGASQTVGAVSFAVFVAAMTAMRVVGGALLDRYGRPVVLRATGALSLAGLLLVVLSGSLPVALVGAALWGLGAALGFPVGMSAASDDPVGAAVRVSVVSSIGYTAFLAGPPLIGFLADEVGVLDALLVVGAALLVGVLCAGTTAPARDRAPTGRPAAAAPPAPAPRR